MKMISAKALVALAVLWTAAPVSAIPVTDTVDPPDTTITFGAVPSPCPAAFSCTMLSALTFVHNISDNGFVVGLDTIISARVAVHLIDHAGGGSESYSFSIGATPQIFSSNNVPSGSGETETVIFNVSSLADLQSDGIISVTVSSTSGSFLFADSVLTAEVTKHVPDSIEPAQNEILAPAQNEIPAPSTLFLLGAGVLATRSWARRRT